MAAYIGVRIAVAVDIRMAVTLARGASALQFALNSRSKLRCHRESIVSALLESCKDFVPPAHVAFLRCHDGGA